MHTERVTYLSTADQKAALEAFARARGESIGSVLREAAASYIGQPSAEEEAELIALTEYANEAIPRMVAAMDAMSANIRAVNEDVGAMLRAKGYR